MSQPTHPRRGWLTLAALLLLVPAAFLGRSEQSRAADPPLGPIDPNNAQQTLLNLVNNLPINNIQNALNNFPVPYVVCAKAGSASTACFNKGAGSPTRIDADQSKATGQGGGGDDIQVEVNTELVPTPHLRLNLTRLGSAPFATNLEVAIAFPFDAFNGETLPAPPNLFFGFRTTGALISTPAPDGSYPAGGNAPATVEFNVTPHVLAGANHVLDLQINTTGPDNPIQFLAGEFDANAGGGTAGIKNALGVAALADPVPSSMTFGLTVNQNLLSPTPTTTKTSLGLVYSASAPTRMLFNYLEGETFPFPGDVPDFQSSLLFDRMPTSESLTIAADFVARTMTLTHASNAPIGKIVLTDKRADGLEVQGRLTDVPTQVSATLDYAGTFTLDVGGTGYPNGGPNTMDIDIIARQAGGFVNTAAYLGYNIGYAEVTGTNLPDLQAGYIPPNKFGIKATNAGESIGSLSFILDDDGTLQLPAKWGASPAWHELSLVDDGTHGTAAARVVDLTEATLTVDSGPTGATTNFVLGSRSPMEIHVDTRPASKITNAEVLATCEIVKMPMGTVGFTIDFPDQFSVTASPDATQVIDSVTCSGHVGTLNFEIGVGSLPVNSGYKFDANGKLEVKVEPTGPNTGFIGFITAHLWDNTSPLPSPFSLPVLFGADALHDARLRTDHIPSFTGTWTNGPNTTFSFDTGIPNAVLYLGGVQVAVSTATGGLLPALATASSSSHDYLTFTDGGTSSTKSLKAGAFGIDSFTYSSTEATHALEMHYRADSARVLDVKFDSRFGGRFFPEFDMNLTLTADAIPASWDLTTDLETNLDYTASAGLTTITGIGDIISKEHNEDGVNATFAGSTLTDTDNPFTDNWSGGIVYAGASKANIASNDATTLTLDAWAPTVPAAATPYFIASKTHVDILATGLPTHVKYALDPSINGSATINMSAPITNLRAEFTSDLKIIHTPYKHMLFEVNDIPADWTAVWGTAPNLHASLSTSSALGAVKVILSRDTLANEADQYAPFTTPGGSVQYTPFAREIDNRYFSQGAGDDTVRQTTFMTDRLDPLYNGTTVLSPGEDHLIMRKNGSGDMTFLSVQGTGFQCAAVQLGPGSLQCGSVTPTVNPGEINASLLLNFPGTHPFYVGMENEPNKFTTVDVPNIPDTTSVIVGTSRAHLDFNASPGTITIYKGALPTAGDFTDALKVQLVNTPSMVHVDWDLSTNGSITVDTDSVLEVRLLTQGGSDRTVADFAVGDLTASWGIDVAEVDAFSCKDNTGFPLFIPFECGTWLTIVGAHASFTANPAIEGFLFKYQKVNSPSDLSGTSPAKNGSEYVPQFNLYVDNFTGISGSASIDVCLLPSPLPIPFVPCLAPGVPVPHIGFSVSGDFNFDYWDLGGGPLNFLGDPDYVGNNPWHLFPIFHDPNNHLFPFGP